MRQIAHSLACEELAYILQARLWISELCICFYRGMRQLVPKMPVKQIGLQRLEDGLSPGKSSGILL